MAAGYVNACGTPEAREAIAFHHSNMMNEQDGNALQVSPDDVIVASGASGALELALTALLDEDSKLLGKFVVVITGLMNSTKFIRLMLLHL